MKQILKQIEKKEAELKKLRADLNTEAKLKYKHIIGKFYQLSATEMIKVTDILYVDDSSVNVECLKISGGKHNGGNIEFQIKDEYYFTFEDIEDNLITEATLEEFIQFLNNAIDHTRQIATKMV